MTGSLAMTCVVKMNPSLEAYFCSNGVCGGDAVGGV